MNNKTFTEDEIKRGRQKLRPNKSPEAEFQRNADKNIKLGNEWDTVQWNQVFLSSWQEAFISLIYKEGRGPTH